MLLRTYYLVFKGPFVHLHCSNHVPITSPPNTWFSSSPAPFPSYLDNVFLKECHPFRCPYDNTPQPRQCVKLTGGSTRHSKAASTMAITVKAIMPIRKSFLQLGCKTFRSSQHGERTLATQTQRQEHDSVPPLPCPLTFLPLCIHRSHLGMGPQ